jgi:hypothetical protein
MSRTESTAVNDLISQVHQGHSPVVNDRNDELQFDRQPPIQTPMPRLRAAGTQVHSVGGRPGSMNRERATLPPPIPGKATLFGAAVTRNTAKRIDALDSVAALPEMKRPSQPVMPDVDVTMDFAPDATAEHAPARDSQQRYFAPSPNRWQLAQSSSAPPHSEEFERESATFLRQQDEVSQAVARRSAPLTLDGTPLERQFAIERAAPATVLYEDSSVMSSAPKAGRSVAQAMFVAASNEPASAQVHGGFDEERWHEFTGSNPALDVAPNRFSLSAAKKWAAPIAGVSLVAAFAIGYLYFNGAHTKPAAVVPSAPVAVQAVANSASIAAMPTVAPAAIATAVVPAAAPIPALAAPIPPPVAVAFAAPVAIEETPPSAKLVNVRFESKPQGATVTIMDNGRATVVGSTPVTAAVDSSQNYDAVFAI